MEKKKCLNIRGLSIPALKGEGSPRTGHRFMVYKKRMRYDKPRPSGLGVGQYHYYHYYNYYSLWDNVLKEKEFLNTLF